MAKSNHECFAGSICKACIFLDFFLQVNNTTYETYENGRPLV